jgi:uncharacterized membrane protein
MAAMAQGLFASLLIGTIISTIGKQFGIPFLVEAGGYASAVAGPAMAVSIGYALQAPQLVLFSLIAVGAAANTLGGAGGPLAVYIIAILACEVGKLVSKETKVDIIVTPAVTILVGAGLVAADGTWYWCSCIFFGQCHYVGNRTATVLHGHHCFCLVGIALTLPISSAAICAALGLTGLAGGAAVAGCCAQMVGFAVMSYKENKIGGSGITGLRHIHAADAEHHQESKIWIAPTLASAITGPLATCSSISKIMDRLSLPAWEPAALSVQSVSIPAGSTMPANRLPVWTGLAWH